MRLRVELVCGLETDPQSTLGRFRLSVTDRPFPLYQASLQAIRTDTERNGVTRLGATYVLLGEWASAAAVLAQAATRPAASALDGFLLALARYHMDQHGEAQRECDRALERLRSNLGDDAAHEMAIEALMTVRHLSLDQAESELRDLSFPADPFAHN